ncbi:MAG: CoB--CoM heterodisulfide reductase iron-sulfur subunit A family protein [Promethearchaeota archaeon]|nr:MAG: CoB--CoM heterodisulfide reductase iron-sulfur subunit A family protein [Candidatus Lokiarchaeota archaeon]
MEGAVLVIGGGIAGIQASLDLTELGFKVYMVEREPSIGGHMAQFDKLYPNNDCSLCILAPKMVAVYRNPNIKLFTLSEVQKISGKAGNFSVNILKQPRYVDETKCRGCGDCAAKCPKIEAPNIFDMNLGKRKSIYIPFPQATPPVYLIDPELCLYLNREVCGVCQKVCKAEAIDYDQTPQTIKLKVGAIVVATGYDMLGQELSSKWGYQYKNVVNALEYERILCPTGPFGTYILRPSDEKEPEKIAFIQCASAGYLEEEIPYCSRVCCMYTAKEAILTKEYAEKSEVFIFRHNIRVFGKKFYEYTKRAQEEFNIKYFHSTIKMIEEDPDTKDLFIHYENLKTEKANTFRANMVVLSAPLIPSKGTQKLAKILDIELDDNNFYKERSYFNKSLSSKDGIYICGSCQAPMNISETVSDASAIAPQIAIILNSEKYSQTKEGLIDILPKKDIIEITPRALIIGGGISGITAALIIGNQGFETIIVEKEKELGGNLKHINILYPIQQESSKVLNELKEKVRTNPQIQVYLESKVKNIEGSIGNYHITVKNSSDKIHEFKVGVIIVATGGIEFKPYGLFEYNEQNQNIITQMELEQKLKSKDRSWLRKIKHMTTIMCAGSRQKGGYSYCSNVCCRNTIKNIEILNSLKPEIEHIVLIRELHISKKDFEELASKRKKIASYLKYDIENMPKIAKIRESPEKFEMKLRDYVNQDKFITFETDLIVLSTPMIPPEDFHELADKIKVPLDEHGFFIEAHNKLRPLDFATHGIFVCGCAQWPKNVQDSISEANGAAGRASRFLNVREISTTKLELLSFILSIECFFKDMIVNVEKCNGCGRCVEVCQFKAISLTDVKQNFEDVSVPAKKAFINPAICKGCGRCAATCRLKAIDPRHYDFKQISAIIDPYFLEKAQSEELEKKMELIISD